MSRTLSTGSLLCCFENHLQIAFSPTAGPGYILCTEGEIIKEKSSEITSHAEEGAHARAHARLLAHKLDSLEGKTPRAFIFFNERHESHMCQRAQRGNNNVDFNSINPLHLSLYHINTCHLQWMR